MLTSDTKPTADIDALHAGMVRDLMACRDNWLGEWSWRALELRVMIRRLEIVDPALEQNRIAMMSNRLRS